MPTETLNEADHPDLPSGYEAQEVWRFRDPTGRFIYAFYRVYGPAEEVGERGPTRAIDPGRSFWSVTWAMDADAPDERVAGRFVSYAEARKSRGSLTFGRFSSLLEMAPGLPALLRVDDTPARSRSSAPIVGVTPATESA